MIVVAAESNPRYAQKITYPGGYLSADVLAYLDKSPRLLASVAGLAKDAEPVSALKETLAKGLHEPR